MPRVIFSPASGGKQKASSDRMFSQMHGHKIFKMQYKILLQNEKMEMFRKIKNSEMRAAHEFNKQNVLCYGH